MDEQTSDGMPSPDPSYPGPDNSGVEIQDFILSRELAEVYLLMDHISAHQSKDIPPSIGAEPIFGGSEKSWLVQICEIAWPPENSSREMDALNAAKLIRAKDALNKAAAPATGASIAFTLMVAGEARDPQGGSWWRRTLMWMAAVPPSGTGGSGGRGWSGTPPPSRASLAELAYPSLSRRAWRYRLMLYLLLFFLVLWLLVTSMLSWDVATGNSLLNQATVDARVSTLQTTAEQSPPDDAVRPADGPPADPSPTAQTELLHATEVRNTALANLAEWMDEGKTEGEDRGKFIRRILIDLMGGADEPTTVEVAVPGSSAPPVTRTNTEWAAVMLGILAGNILPIFYGLLGAGAAVVRGVSTKMRDSLLSPRDIWLAYVQLALGAVIGACIGLFVNSEGDAGSEAGLLGSVPLSASALCFVAGFGVEGVFQALESLLRRVFNLDTDRPAPPG